MNVCYVTTHQIHNLVPLFRSLNNRKEIKFEVLYWQNLSQTYYDVQFKKIINFGLDQEYGYKFNYLNNKERKFAKFNFFFEVIILFKLIKKILNSKYDIIIFHEYRLSHIFSSIFAKILKKKTVMRAISYNLGKRSFGKNIIRNLFYKISNLFFDEFWYIHNLNKDFFKKFGVKDKNLFFVDHCQGEYDKLIHDDVALQLSKDDFCRKYNLPNQKKFILFAGRFNERKNPHILIDAFLRAKITNEWYLIMIGNGEYESDLKEFVIKNNIKNIKFLNFKDQKELISFFKNSEILVLPSNVGDTHGNIAAEAIQFGCALILSNMVGFKS